MNVFEKSIAMPRSADEGPTLAHFSEAVQFQIPRHGLPLRFAITESSNAHFQCELGLLNELPSNHAGSPDSIFQFSQRGAENSEQFNIALVVPTGIGAEIGGHAGDATPVAKLLGEICDRLITHPNVVNASDINEIPENALYVEGSVLSRLLMGTVGLQPVRSNRVLVVIDAHEDSLFVNAAINAVSAARATYGLRCPGVIQIDPPIRMTSRYTASGSAMGEIENLESLCDVLRERRDDYDAVAISSVISVPHSYHQDYFDSMGTMVNPWGGVEAMLTHAVSMLFDVPSAHSPMFESREIANVDPGIVEPRMAAEAVSVTFLQCILKGLQRSPRIITKPEEMRRPDIVTAEDVSCLVIPDGCVGLPTLAALQQGITVIAVRENKNLMKNDLTELPWGEDQFYQVENYWEAAGIIVALKAGTDPWSTRRPLTATKTEVREQKEKTRPSETATG